MPIPFRTLAELDHDVDNVSSLSCDLARILPNTNRMMIRGSADVGLTALTILTLASTGDGVLLPILHPLESSTRLFLKIPDSVSTLVVYSVYRITEYAALCIP